MDKHLGERTLNFKSKSDFRKILGLSVKMPTCFESKVGGRAKVWQRCPLALSSLVLRPSH